MYNSGRPRVRASGTAAMAQLGPADRSSGDPELLRLLAENVPDVVVFGVDADGQVVSWNRGAERLFGYRADELLGRPVDRVFTTNDPDSGPAEADRWLVRKDGRRFWASSAKIPLHEVGFAFIVRDRTDLKRAEDAR